MNMDNTKKMKWRGWSRRDFLREFGIASSAITLSPFFLERWTRAFAQSLTEKVIVVKNGDCFQNTAKLWDLLSITKYINPTDIG